MKRPLSIRRILQALYYLQSKAPSDNQDRFTKVYLLKMLYFADRYHLRHFGCLATGDNYVAMKLGPVASVTFDMLKRVPNIKNSAGTDYLSAIKELSEHEVKIEPQKDDELTESFKRSLDFALKEFGHFNWIKQSKISHCYVEWKKHETSLSVNLSIPMDTSDFFDDPEDETCFSEFKKAYDPFKDDKEYLRLRKESFGENAISSR